MMKALQLPLRYRKVAKPLPLNWDGMLQMLVFASYSDLIIYE